MTIDRKPVSLMRLLPARVRGIGRIWVQMAALVALCLLFIGPFMPIMLVALLLTLGAPILVLYLWGRALDEQMGWLRREEDEGPW